MMLVWAEQLNTIEAILKAALPNQKPN